VLIWAISLDPFLSSIVHFTKLTGGKSDIAMADKPKLSSPRFIPTEGGRRGPRLKLRNEPKTGARRRKPSDMKKQNKANYHHFQSKNQGRTKKQSQNGLPNHEKTKRTQIVILSNMSLPKAHGG
jgi:hypothetical protein